jgi:NADPH:quinone reductase-like Zn-dependent oxidoreductase
MHAITVSGYGSRPSVTELPTPQAGPGQVLIAIQARTWRSAPVQAQHRTPRWRYATPQSPRPG